MAGRNFWDRFFENGDNSDDPDIVYGDIPYYMQGVFRNLVSASPDYDELTTREKQFIADEFTEYFLIGGGNMHDQEAFFALIGLGPRDFDWETYHDAYEPLAGR